MNAPKTPDSAVFTTMDNASVVMTNQKFLDEYKQVTGTAFVMEDSGPKFSSIKSEPDIHDGSAWAWRMWTKRVKACVTKVALPTFESTDALSLGYSCAFDFVTEVTFAHLVDIGKFAAVLTHPLLALTCGGYGYCKCSSRIRHEILHYVRF